MVVFYENARKFASILVKKKKEANLQTQRVIHILSRNRKKSRKTCREKIFNSVYDPTKLLLFFSALERVRKCVFAQLFFFFMAMPASEYRGGSLEPEFRRRHTFP